MKFPRFLKRPVKVELARINASSVTETLMRAVEYADKMKFVVVLYETKDEEESSGGVFTQDEVTFAQINWLLDRAKQWLLSP